MTPQPIHNPIGPRFEIGTILSGIIAIFILVAAIFAFFLLLTGGIQWITSGGDKGALENARNRIVHAIVGLIIIASIWAIIAFIFPILGLSFPGFEVPFIGKGLETI